MGPLSQLWKVGKENEKQKRRGESWKTVPSIFVGRAGLGGGHWKDPSPSSAAEQRRRQARPCCTRGWRSVPRKIWKLRRQ